MAISGRHLQPVQAIADRMQYCRGGDSRARRNAADPNRLSPKRNRPPELSLRGPKGAVAISGRHCRLVQGGDKT